ncbi:MULTISPECIES: hypothetical protein [Bacillus cereus group]|uniref:hypothetical protein n=1 Tax=Bacillus cereus group TaxID=86661 RepID=UPI001F59328F|nr:MULTISPECIES: hypothetical protein [Bacillus cereus group]MED0970497.1 hypothetical protein [Bacillus paramycoides]MED0984545.1 hypothetical protein [Bacillus paramycoides]MED1108004.1 hypothetical protein [Bacillus paramycoides]
MIFFMLVISVGLIFFVHYITKQMFKYEVNHLSTKKRFIINLLQFVRIAPLIAVLVICILVLTTLHTKTGIRLSHAWYAAQFWAYYTFLYCIYMITRKKPLLFSMVISLIMAIYYTPLFHFENQFIGLYVVVANICAILMFVNLWMSISKVLVGMKNR